MVQETEEEGGNSWKSPGYIGSHGNEKHKLDVVTGTQGEGEGRM